MIQKSLVSKRKKEIEEEVVKNVMAISSGALIPVFNLLFGSRNCHQLFLFIMFFFIETTKISCRHGFILFFHG